jgi:hypothetical protein
MKGLNCYIADMHSPRIAKPSSRRRFLSGAAIAASGLAFPSLLGPSSSPRELAAAPGELTAPDLLRPRLLPRAMAALETHAHRIPNRDVIGVVDFAQASRDPRFHVIDIGNGDVSTHLVAHGSGSDPDRSGWVQRFSNQPDSNASSRGAFVTGETYVGKHGLSRRLVGLGPENNMAESRGIVIHAASYVSEALAIAQGRIGRSQGCFAVADEVIGEVLERLGPGRLILAWK